MIKTVCNTMAHPGNAAARVLIAVLAASGLLATSSWAQTYGPWSVKRGRSTDSDVAGGYPGWSVTFSGPQETPTLVIDGDDDGGFRGTILVGRHVRITERRLWSLQFDFATVCANRNRRGGLDILVITPEAWADMTDDPETEEIFDARHTTVCLGRYSVQSHVGEDIPAPIPVPDTAGPGVAALLSRYVGRDVVLALAWTALHSTPEHAILQEVTLVEKEPEDAVKALFQRLDLSHEGLADVQAAYEDERIDAATEHLVAYYRNRREPAMPGDPRLIEKPTASGRQTEEADAAMENRFIGQSKYGYQKVPDDIDWRFNPTEDPEWTWQFNRHSAWSALAAVYRASGDERYAEHWVELMRDWIAENPPGTPWSWRTLEVGIRISRWIPIYFSFVESPAFTPIDQVQFLNSLANHAEYLLPKGRFHSGSNWGQTESMGLLRIGSFMPEFKAADTWKETAWERLENEMFRQVYPDGAQHELTTSYHQGTIRGFIGAAEIAKLGGHEPSDEYWQRLERMVEYTMILQKPDGTQPMLGDSWPGNTSGVLLNGAERFDRDDMLYVGSRGTKGRPPAFLDAALPSAGYYVMRTGWVDPQAVYALVDVAHHWGGGHQQPDALQINLYAYGRTLLPDSGSYLYYGPGRREFARTASHSTLTVDNRNQNTSPARINAFFTSDALSVVDGEHSGYDDVTHRRQVLFVRPQDRGHPYVVVVDRVTGAGEHLADVYYHFLPGPFEARPDQLTAQSTLPDGPNLLTMALPSPGLTMEEVPSEVSFVYTQKEPRPAVRYRLHGDLPVTIVTLLLPFPGATAPDWTVRELKAEGEGSPVALEITMDGVRDVLYASDRLGSVRIGDTKASGLAGLIRTTQGEASPSSAVSVDRTGIDPGISRRWSADLQASPTQ